jgi:hypothetical protein
MKKFSLFAVVSLLLLTGCSNSDDAPATKQDNAIEFRQVVDKTRASLVGATIELQSFYVKGQQAGVDNFDFLSASVNRTGAASFDYSPKKYWPTDDSYVYFYAFAPYSNDIVLTPTTSNNATFPYTVSNDQSGRNTAVDLLVAKANGNSTTLGATAVSFAFTHALSAATFSAVNENGINSELVYTISKIELKDLYNKAVYSYENTGSWGTYTNVVDYIAGVPESGVAVQPVGVGGTAVKLLSDNDVMMVLPQTVAVADVVEKVWITYSLRDGSGAYIYKDAEKKIDLTAAEFKFIPGMLYNFVFKFGKSDAITLEVTSVASWTDETTDI